MVSFRDDIPEEVRRIREELRKVKIAPPESSARKHSEKIPTKSVGATLRIERTNAFIVLN